MFTYHYATSQIPHISFLCMWHISLFLLTVQLNCRFFRECDFNKHFLFAWWWYGLIYRDHVMNRYSQTTHCVILNLQRHRWRPLAFLKWGGLSGLQNKPTTNVSCQDDNIMPSRHIWRCVPLLYWLIFRHLWLHSKTHSEARVPQSHSISNSLS